MNKTTLYFYISIVLVLFTAACSTKPNFKEFTSQYKIVDLTQTLNQQIPIWPGDPEFKTTPWATYEKDQYFINQISIGEHSGTHWGTPNTFIKGTRSAEKFKAHELVLPAVVIDISNVSNKDYLTKS